MNGQRVLAVEFVILVGVASWGALRQKYYPWPPTIVKTALFMSLLGVVSALSEEFAATLGAGFIVANLVRMYSTGTTYMGGVPVDASGSTTGFGYPLNFKGPAAKQSNPTSPNPVNPGPGLGPTRPIV